MKKILGTILAILVLFCQTEISLAFPIATPLQGQSPAGTVPINTLPNPSYATHAIMGAISPGATFGSVIGESLKYGTISGVGELGKATGLDPNLTRLAAITAGSLVEGGFNGMSYTDVMKDIAPNLLGEVAYMGVTEVGSLLGIDSRYTNLIGVGLRSAVSIGLSPGSTPSDLWGSVILGAAQGALNLGIEYIGQQAKIDPIYMALITRVASGALEGIVTPIDPKDPDGAKKGLIRGAVEGVFDSAKNTLTLGGIAQRDDLWSRSAHTAQVLEITRSIAENGLSRTLETYATNILQQDAINSLTRTGYKIGEYIERKITLMEVEPVTAGDGKSANLIGLGQDNKDYLITRKGSDGKDELLAVRDGAKYREADIGPDGKPDWTKFTQVTDNQDGTWAVSRIENGRVVSSTIIDSISGTSVTFSETKDYPLHIRPGETGNIVRNGVVTDNDTGLTLFFKDGKVVKDIESIDTIRLEQDLSGNMTIEGLTKYKERIYNPEDLVEKVKVLGSENKNDEVIDAIRKSSLSEEEKRRFFENLNIPDPNNPDFPNFGATLAPGRNFIEVWNQIQTSGGAIGGTTPVGGMIFAAATNLGTKSAGILTRAYNANEDNNEERKRFWQSTKDKFFNNKKGDEFIHVAPKEFKEDILKSGLKKDLSTYATKEKYIEKIKNPAKFETTLYRKDTQAEKRGKFSNGAVIFRIKSQSKPKYKGLTNMEAGIPQWEFDHDIAPEDIEIIGEL